MLETMDREFLHFALSLYVPGFFINLGWGLVSPILPLYAESFGISYVLVGLVITSNALGRIFCDIPLGAVCDRVGRRPLAIFGPLLVTASALLCGLAQGFYELVLYRLITGIGMAMWMIARQAIIADSVNPAVRGRVLGTFQGVNMIGSATGPAIGGIIADLWGYRAPFYFYAASTLACLVTSLLMVKESAPLIHCGTRSRIGIDLQQFLGLLSFPIVMAALTNFTNHVRFAARATLVPLYGNDVIGLTTWEIGLVLSASTVANIATVMPGGYVVDRYGRKAGLIPAFLFSGLAFILFPFFNSLWGITIIAILLGVASGFGGGAAMVVGVDLSPEDSRGVFMGFWQTIGDLGMVITPVALGFFADNYGWISPFFFTAALMFVTAATTQLFVRETMKAETKKTCE